VSELKSAFICNQNQARSQVLSAVFSELFAPHIFLSFGLIAQENTPLPLVIASLLSDWGLDPVDRVAMNMLLHLDEIFEMDVVLAVTTFIADEIRNLGFKGQIVDLQHEAELLGVDVMDPQLMPRRQCAFELAKYLKVTYSSLQRLGYIQNHKTIKALIPEKESSISNALELALEEKHNDSVIIYGDLVAPRNDLFNKYFGPTAKYRFNGSTFSIDSASTESSREILVPAHAVMWPSKIYLGTVWLHFFEQIEEKEIILITPPMQTKKGMMAESYLAALRATAIHVVQSPNGLVQ
jgi:protein-tyrosine-phosphatase